jgi:hypothetical protein
MSTQNRSTGSAITHPLYEMLVQQLPTRPNLSILQDKQPWPEEWPVIFMGMETYRKQIQGFRISDGMRTLVCKSTLPEVYQQIAVMEEGTIFHVLQADTVFDEALRGYTLNVPTVMTLRQFDHHLSQLRAAEAQRQARLAQEESYYTY